MQSDILDKPVSMPDGSLLEFSVKGFKHGYKVKCIRINADLTIENLGTDYAPDQLHCIAVAQSFVIQEMSYLQPLNVLSNESRAQHMEDFGQ